MTCVSDSCNQGRKKCPTPRLCTDNGGARIDNGQVIGYESAGRVPDPPPPPKLRDRIDPQALVIVLACIATWVGVYLASVWPFH
jgi:hypothetical protein